MEIYLTITLLLSGTLRLATPLILAALGGMFSERAGVIDLGLEGKILGAAFAAAAVSAVTGSAWLGLAAGMAAGMVLAGVVGYACITRKGNQVVAGMAVTFIVVGLAPTLGQAWFNHGGQTPQLDGPGMRFGAIAGGFNLMVYIAVAVVPAAAWLLYRTRFGLRLRAVGENPQAVESAGLSVARLRYHAVLISGALCGVAGTYLSTAAGAGFVRDMSAGKGYLALAALIFGKWKPWPTFFACLLFAFTDALGARLQGVEIPGIGQIPVQFLIVLPYILTVLILAGFVGRASPPRALGQSF